MIKSKNSSVCSSINSILNVQLVKFKSELQQALNCKARLSVLEKLNIQQPNLSSLKMIWIKLTTDTHGWTQIERESETPSVLICVDLWLNADDETTEI